MGQITTGADSNPDQWVLNGLPLTMARNELLHLPLLGIVVADATQAGTGLDAPVSCELVVRLAMRTDKRTPVLADQVIVLTRSDIRETQFWRLAEAPQRRNRGVMSGGARDPGGWPDGYERLRWMGVRQI